MEIVKNQSVPGIAEIIIGELTEHTRSASRRRLQPIVIGRQHSVDARRYDGEAEIKIDSGGVRIAHEHLLPVKTDSRGAIE